MKKERGITLIALVITIIVLLVLAGVSLSLVLGENGVLKKSQKATTETRNAEEKEKIEMAVAAARAAGNGVLTTENLNTELGKVFGEGKTVKESKVRRLPVEYEEVEYIESTGTQYIDTNYKASNKTKVELTFSTVNSFTETSIIGARSDYRLNAFDFTLHCGGWYVYGNTEKQSSADFSNNIKYDVVINNNTLQYKLSSDYTFVEINSFTEQIFTTDYPLYMFAENWKGSANFNSKVSIYSLKISENETLKKEFVPCCRKSDNKPGMYDLVEGKFYTNEGTGTFNKGEDIETSEIEKWNYELDNNKKYIINNDGKVEQFITDESQSLLPPEYQQVEYIESTGTQYINTKLSMPNGFLVEFKINSGTVDTASDTYNGVFGCEEVYKFRNYISFIRTHKILLGLGNTAYAYGPDWNEYNDYTVEFCNIQNHTYLAVNGISNSFNVNGTEGEKSDKEIYFLGMNAGTQIEYAKNRKAYYCKIYLNYDKTNIVRDYIPCYSITTVTDVNGKQCPSGTKGLYDLVEGKFYTNQGSGDDFIAGPDV